MGIFAYFVVASIKKEGQNTFEILSSSASPKHKEKRHERCIKNISSNISFEQRVHNDCKSENDSNYNDNQEDSKDSNYDNNKIKNHDDSNWLNKQNEETMTIILIRVVVLIFIGYLIGEVLKLE